MNYMITIIYKYFSFKQAVRNQLEKKKLWRLKVGNSLAVQWLGLHALTAKSQG